MEKYPYEKGGGLFGGICPGEYVPERNIRIPADQALPSLERELDY